MTLDHICPVVLAGGSGTRLWPLSREHFPKQFQTLVGKDSLFQQTMKRFSYLPQNPIVVTNHEHRFLVAEQLHAMHANATIILEPVARNTAPAIALAAFHALEHDKDSILLISPADHWFNNPDQFSEVTRAALEPAQDGAIVLFGIRPTHAETGYGYIEVQSSSDSIVSNVLRFIEKPNQQDAERFIASSAFVWNSGIFCMRADVYLNVLQQVAQEVFQAAKQAYELATRDADFTRIDLHAYLASPSISIDYAVMEKLGNTSVPCRVVSSDLVWNDLGSWSALWEIAEKDALNNAVSGDVFLRDTKDCFVRADDRLVVMLGMQNTLVIDTNDALLIADKEHASLIKQAVEYFSDEERLEVVQHVTVRRPWGLYQQIDAAERYQVKRITVKPGARLSLQKHHHRAEHWIVVKGTAKVTRGDEIFNLYENQSTYIPHGTVHRLENPGIIPLEIIEVQSGSYLGEDDIVRYDDEYGRVVEV